MRGGGPIAIWAMPKCRGGQFKRVFPYTWHVVLIFQYGIFGRENFEYVLIDRFKNLLRSSIAAQIKFTCGGGYIRNITPRRDMGLEMIIDRNFDR